MNTDPNDVHEALLKVIKNLTILVIILVIAILLMPVIFYNNGSISNFFTQSPKENTGAREFSAPTYVSEKTAEAVYWKAPVISSIENAKQKEQVAYGKDLIAHTAKYLGPKGSVIKISNGMNCQNCHLEAGTKVWGNNYGSVASLYPRFRARSGSVENIYKRVNDCIERSLNGKPLDTLGKEMQAIKAYIEFLGANVEKGKKADGSGFKDLTYLDRASDPEKGKLVFEAKCINCHQADGGGKLNADGSEYTYPPLWGSHSYNDGAGLFRITSIAKYVKYNMPFGVNYESTQLTDEEAWDVAAFVSAQTRPHKDVPRDWPDKSKKPIDHPFGPYADNFSEKQHKYGPFKPILAEQKKREEDSKQKATALLK